jgi:hypothetical protein
MQHLNLEDIARLVDEAPEPAEAAHLRDCLACRRELKEMQAQTRALAALPDVDPPAGAWRGLEAALAAESLIRPQPVRAIWYHHAGTRAAAARYARPPASGWRPEAILPRRAFGASPRRSRLGASCRRSRRSRRRTRSPTWPKRRPRT